MSKYSMFPFTVVNGYISSFLEAEDVLPATVQVKGLAQPTIVPATETPELQDSSVPGYLVYALGLDQHEKNPETNCESMSYTIYSDKAAKVHEVIYALQDLFSHADWSAADLNAYHSARGDKYFHFLCTEFEIITGPVRLDDEGGRYAALVDVHYDYVKPIVETPGPRQGMRP